MLGATTMKVAKVFLAALLVSGAAEAASLEYVQGDVRVGRGEGFRTVQGPMDLSPGDKVKVGGKGLARIVYSDGCVVNLGANALATVADRCPCSFMAQDDGSDQQDCSCEGIACLGPPALIAGNVGAAVGAALASQGGSGNSPASLLLLMQKPASP